MTFRDTHPHAAAPALNDFRIIDVREPHEYHGDLGHLPGAELVPLSTLASSVTEWDRDAPMLVVCRSGKRSSAACQALAHAGFTAVHNLDGGMLAWNAHGLDACARPHGNRTCSR